MKTVTVEINIGEEGCSGNTDKYPLMQTWSDSKESYKFCSLSKISFLKDIKWFMTVNIKSQNIDTIKKNHRKKKASQDLVISNNQIYKNNNPYSFLSKKKLNIF